VATFVIRLPITLNTDFHHKGTEEIFAGYDKNVNFGGNYVEKWCHGSTIKCNVFLSDANTKKPKYISTVNVFYDTYSYTLDNCSGVLQ
jgi:hypothetical protein